ncbi:MAG TPA: bifunctional phosphoglucose/phosphomannose isomerase [Chitinophagales bacterium]|nr:bifunctional phosphoglucose/phosphomannose isomerase [Chitinophagales bacterium]
MYELIKTFPAQLREAITIGDKTISQTGEAEVRTIKNIVICGLGGSGIGGNILSELLLDELKVPVVVNKSYFLPAFVDADTLLILASYSGDTEETVSCANQAISRGLKPVCVTSGGKLGAIAKANEFMLFLIPGGFPPRACLGYSGIQLFFVLHHYGLIGNGFKEVFYKVADLLEEGQEEIMANADLIAGKLLQKVIVLYTEDKYESTALRLKQQINENAKLHCWYNVIPEMNHNELVGWREANNALAVLILRSNDEYQRNTERILFKKAVIEKLSENVHEVDAQGANTFEKHFYLIHFGDWLSYYLAVKQGYDPMEIDVLVKLKGHMNALK